MTNINELAILNTFIDKNPKNKRRRRNKIILENDSFELIYDVKSNDVQVVKKDDLFFSIIPYDTSRKYIETAVLMFLEKPTFLDDYLKKHAENLKTYVSIALFQVTGHRFEGDSTEVLSELAYLETDIYFKIQVVGRLLQHDETGPLSATLPYKFLYQFNLKTGIHGFIKEWLIFLSEVNQHVPMSLAFNQSLRIESANQLKDQTGLVTLQSAHGLTLRKSELTREQLAELMVIRKDYKPQSKHPSEIAQYFDVVHPNKTENLINVVSDIQGTSREIPLESPYFNIIAGNIVASSFEEEISDHNLKGIAVIGNHDIAHCAKLIGEQFTSELLSALTDTIDTDYSVLRFDDQPLYAVCKSYLENRMPGLTFLNNDIYYHDNVRYIGLTLPVNYSKEKFLVQKQLATILKQLLGQDKEQATVIVSHSPLFNELSLLSKSSSSYDKNFTCVNDDIQEIFKEYSILGVIHGHHHIPASTGVLDFREFAGREVFVLCSIYSSINKGFDLEPVMKQLLNRRE